MQRRLHNNEAEEDFDKQSSSKRKRSNEEIEVKQENSEETAIKNEPLVDEEENEESTIINYNSMPYVLEPGEILPVTKEEDILDDEQPKTSDTDDQDEVFALTESTNDQHQSGFKGSSSYLDKIASPPVKLSKIANSGLVKRILRNSKALSEKQDSVPTPGTIIRVTRMLVTRLKRPKALSMKLVPASTTNPEPGNGVPFIELPTTIAPELSQNSNPMLIKRVCYTDKNLMKKLVPFAPPSNTNSNVKLFKIMDIQRPQNKIIITTNKEKKQETNNRRNIGKRVTYENRQKLLLAPESQILSSSEEETPVPVPSNTPKAVNVNKKLSVLPLPNEPSIEVEFKFNTEEWPKLLSLPCPICGEAVDTEPDLFNHLNEAHLKNRSDEERHLTMCQLCLEQTPAKHIFWHTTSRSCRKKWIGSCKCHLTFDNFEELQYHIAEKHPKSIPQNLNDSQKLWPVLLSMPCLVCFVVYKRETILRHIKTWHPGPILCLFCKELVEKKDVWFHRISASCRATWTKGCQCVIKCADWEEFQTHLRLKHPQNEKKEEDQEKNEEKPENSMTGDSKNEEIPKTAKKFLKKFVKKQNNHITCRLCSETISTGNYVSHFREFHPKPGPVQMFVKKTKKNEEKPETVKPGPVKKLVKKKNEEKPGTAKPGPLKKFVTQPNNPFMTCPLCDETIKTIDCLSHIRELHKSETSHPTNMHTCKHCKRDVSLRNITTHILNMCASAHRYCFWCKEKQTNWMFLINHLDEKHKTYCCDTCNVVCGDPLNYQQHKKSTFHEFNSNPDAKEKCIKKRPKNFCPLCPIGAVVQNLQLHLRIIHSDVMMQPDNLNNCQVCKQDIKTTDLVEHTKVCLDEQMPFCDICQISFMHKDIFEQHLSIHAPPGAIPLKDNGPCPLCLEKDPQGSLILHLKVKHSNFREIKVFRCVFCDLLIKGSFLLNHANSRECREKRICSVCSAVFKDWNALGAHKCEKLVENQNS